MARSGSQPKGFFDLLTSGWTLLPAVLGLSALEVGWFLDQNLDWYLYGAGACGVVALIGFLGQWFLGGGAKLSADVLQAREDLLANLETLGRGLQRRLANEGTSAGSMAPVEK